jgi:HemY protein
VRAPRDPAWVADGYVAERWAPASPVTGKLDAFEWRSPVERLGQLIEPDEPERPALAPPPHPEPAQAEPARAETEAKLGEAKAAEAAAAPPAAMTDAGASEEAAAPVTTANGLDDDDEVAPDEPPLPDDPGVRPEDQQEKSQRRFRLF